MRVRNWDKWQSWRKDRGAPPWIKVHRRLMQDPNWVELSDAQRGQLVAIWMLAADRDGVIPASPRTIQKLCCMDSEPDLQAFADKGFLELDANVTPTWRQLDPPEEKRIEVETEEKKNNSGAVAPKKISPRDELLTVLNAQTADGVIQHRQRLGKALTPRAAHLLAKEFARAPDPNAAADEMLARGWQGFKVEWLASGRVGPPGKVVSFTGGISKKFKPEKEIAVLPASERAAQVDRILSKTVNALKANGGG